jgi:tRNA pseudouridine13 synthase
VDLPYLTADLPGTGGVLRAQPEDFVVDEVPAYPPSGAGDHVFVRIEKRGLNTAQAVQRIARVLGVGERDIGVAGMKDRHAVTRQWLSLPPPVTPEAALAFADPDVRVLEAARHGHKLRTGHVRANQFVLRVRDAVPDAVERARAILDVLAKPPGAPNWYGEQRFGRDGDNAARGRAIVMGEKPPRAGDGAGRASPVPRDRKLARLLVSSLQSELFNQWLVARMADGLYARVLAGDVLHKNGGGMFTCEDAATDEARLAAGELVVTGPMFGAAMRSAVGDAGAREDAILGGAGLTRESFASVSRIAEGTRRDASIQVGEASVAAIDGTLEVRFTLPGGAYATAVMREIMK